jgi:hypothetical protein
VELARVAGTVEPDSLADSASTVVTAVTRVKTCLEPTAVKVTVVEPVAPSRLVNSTAFGSSLVLFLSLGSTFLFLSSHIEQLELFGIGRHGFGASRSIRDWRRHFRQ